MIHKAWIENNTYSFDITHWTLLNKKKKENHDVAATLLHLKKSYKKKKVKWKSVRKSNWELCL